MLLVPSLTHEPQIVRVCSAFLHSYFWVSCYPCIFMSPILNNFSPTEILVEALSRDHLVQPPSEAGPAGARCPGPCLAEF